ncbi:MAG: magnesium transporter CorA [Oligoflexia bacterium]|nr:magnesium transporter CorA [Oligoflexia bacterium]
MMRKVLEKDGFHWIDLVSPSHEELDQISKEFGLPSQSVQDCLDPEHLPKVEKFEDHFFIIVRAFGDRNFDDPDAHTVQDLTRKIAVFLRNNVIITIRRSPISFLEQLVERWSKQRNASKELSLTILTQILEEVIWSYERPLDRAEETMDQFESRVFSGKQFREDLIEEVYFLKRKVSVVKKLLRRVIDVTYKIDTNTKYGLLMVEDLRQDGDRLSFFADSILENLDNLLATNLSIASHRTGEVLRVLTLFSVFFMPLTFIVGIYGMNFKFMPELEWPLGYLGIWILMVSVTALIFIWFKRKGWLN